MGRAVHICSAITIETAIRTGGNTQLLHYICHANIYVMSRSPWTNKYFPPIDDGFLPSEKLRAMEMEANELFDSYRELYFEGGTSSVYLWDLANGFAGCFLIKKSEYCILHVYSRCSSSVFTSSACRC